MTPTALADLVLRQRCTVEGWVVDVTPREDPWVRLDVEVTDGSGALVLRFMGRRAIPGMVPRRELKAEGTPAEVDGQRVMLNPSYSLLPCRVQ